MSACGAMVRDPTQVSRESRKAWDLVGRVANEMAVPNRAALAAVFRLKDLALTHALYLEAIREYLEKGGRSRGSYLVPGPKGEKPCPTIEDRWRFELSESGDFVSGRILEIGLDEKGRVRKAWRETRPVPKTDPWFEKVWKDFRADRIIKEEG